MKKYLNNNIVIQTFSAVSSVLPPNLRKTGLFVLLLLLLNSALEIFGLAALMPLILTLLSDGGVQSNNVLNYFFELGGFESEAMFVSVLCSLILVTMVVKNALSLVILHRQAKYSYRLMQYFSEKIIRIYYGMGFSFFKTNNSNFLVRNVNHTPLQFANQIVLPLINLFTEFVILVLIVIGIVLVDVKIIALLAAIVLPPFFLFYRYVKNRITVIKTELHSLEPRTNQNVFQSIFGYSDVKISNTESFFFQRHAAFLTRRVSLWSKDFVYQSAPTKVVETALVFGLIVITMYGLFWVDREHLVALLSVFAVAAYRTLPSVNRIMLALMSLKSHSYALDIIVDVDKDEAMSLAKVVGQPNVEEVMKFDDGINFQNISFKYDRDSEMVLKDFNLKVKKGDRVGIIGRSGSGKTTLINIFLRFLSETEGSIEVDGQTLNEQNVGSWRNLIGYVQQDVFMLDATLAENVAFGRDLDDVDPVRLENALKSASILDFVKSLPDKERTMIGERGTLISGGQRQRLGIARALYHGAQILVFDEATSALDVETERNITNSIRDLGENNITMFVVAHRISTLKYCQRIIQLENGNIEGVYRFEDLQNRGEFEGFSK